MDIRLFVAAKAFVVYQGKILILQESGQYQDGTNVGKYDVVGGRVKPGERFDDGLLREIKEETGLDVTIGRPFFVNEWRPVVRDEPWQIVGIFFACEATTDQVQLSEDHAAYQWIDPADYTQYPLIENLLPAFAEYLAEKKER